MMSYVVKKNSLSNVRESWATHVMEVEGFAGMILNLFFLALSQKCSH